MNNSESSFNYIVAQFYFRLTLDPGETKTAVAKLSAPVESSCFVVLSLSTTAVSSSGDDDTFAVSYASATCPVRHYMYYILIFVT